jgi:hypothetical protein
MMEGLMIVGGMVASFVGGGVLVWLVIRNNKYLIDIDKMAKAALEAKKLAMLEELKRKVNEL